MKYIVAKIEKCSVYFLHGSKAVSGRRMWLPELSAIYGAETQGEHEKFHKTILPTNPHAGQAWQVGAVSNAVSNLSKFTCEHNEPTPTIANTPVDHRYYDDDATIVISHISDKGNGAEYNVTTSTQPSTDQWTAASNKQDAGHILPPTLTVPQEGSNDIK